MIIRYFAWIKNITNVEEEIIQNKAIDDINTLKKYLLKKYPELKKYMKNNDVIRFAVNFEYVTNNQLLKPKDEIAIFPPVSGG
tara:strand:+ start:1447 stop:1695 length:249 start_codon:yes stop_codon:yes gene_type:complete